MTSATDGVEVPAGDDAGPDIEVPDELHRRIARPGPDGKVIEVLAARRGVTMRPGPVGGAGGTGDLNPVGQVMPGDQLAHFRQRRAAPADHVAEGQALIAQAGQYRNAGGDILARFQPT